MAKTRAPLLSIDASGSIADAITYRRTKGTTTASHYAKPTGQPTPAQRDLRATIRSLSRYWRKLNTQFQEPWTFRAAGTIQTPTGLLTKINTDALYQAGAWTPIRQSIGQYHLPAPATVIATAGPSSGTLKVDVTAQTVPPGWTIDRMQGIVMPIGNVYADIQPNVRLIGDTASPYSGTASTLQSGTPCVASAYFRYLSIDGEIAYGPSINAIGNAKV